jgi:glutamate-1-semialdehyde 2,1-aminomutase
MPTARDLTRSNAQFRKALTRLPLGVSSSFRYWGEDRTLYIARGKGARLWDIDGNAYIDYRLGYGPVILGHADDRVDAAARRGMEIGGVFALATEREYSVADRICRMVPGMDLVRFSNSGTEAVMAALRLARAHTGRDEYVLVEGGYHGLFDAGFWGVNLEDWNPGQGEPAVMPWSGGVPDRLRALVHVVPMNDPQRLEDVFRRHGDRIAALLIEPIQGNCCGISARPDYVRLARELCTRAGALMVIDEVKTGFRVAKGGVQSLLGVVPDIATFAKAMANGYPISAIAGRAEVMRSFRPGKAAHGGTYTAHAVSLAAAEETLRILDETPALATIEAYGTRLKAGLSAILARRGVPHSFTGHPSMFGLFFAEVPPDNYRDWKRSDYTLYDRVAHHLHDLRILCEPDSREPWFSSEAHDDACLAETLAAFGTALDMALADTGTETSAHTW